MSTAIKSDCLALLGHHLSDAAFSAKENFGSVYLPLLVFGLTSIGAKAASSSRYRMAHGVVDRLNYLREPGQSYSDVILRLAEGV